MSAQTNESPQLGRFSPLRPFMRVQRYAQNNPRRYGFRVGLLSAGLGAVPMLLVCLPLIIASGDPLSFWPLYVSALLMVLILPAAGAWAGPRFVRWLTRKGAAIPGDADPSRQWAAQKLLRKGELSGDPETDRLARGLTGQAERANSPRFFVVMLLLSVLPFGFLVASELSRTGGLPPFLGGMLLFLIVIWGIAIPWAMRHRRKAREFQEAYDARYGGPEEERPRPEGHAEVHDTGSRTDSST